MQNLKVMVFGKEDCGKSTLIRTMIPDAVHVDDRRRSMAMDIGSIEVDGTAFRFFGIPGWLPFRGPRELMVGTPHCALLVFDGCRPMDDADREILRGVISLNIPFMAIMNEKKGHLPWNFTETIKELCRTCPNFMGVIKGSVRNYGFSHRVLYEIQQFSCRCRAA
jgi:signal recognition particle receptor subunit beta